MAEMNKHGKLGLASLRAGMDRGTAQKYLSSGKLPSATVRPERTYQTRADPFAADWAWLEAMLVDAPELEAKALFDHMTELRPGRYEEGQLRTLQQRRVAFLYASYRRATSGHSSGAVRLSSSRSMSSAGQRTMWPCSRLTL